MREGEGGGKNLNPRSLFLSQNKNEDWKQLTEDAQKILEQLIDFKVLPAEFKKSLSESDKRSLDAITEENSEENAVQKEIIEDETGNAALPLALITIGTTVGSLGVLVFIASFFKK